jgi:hypothetical protein
VQGSILSACGLSVSLLSRLVSFWWCSRIESGVRAEAARCEKGAMVSNCVDEFAWQFYSFYFIYFFCESLWFVECWCACMECLRSFLH